MNDTRQPAGADGLPLQGPHWLFGPSRAAACDFAPLRLELLPSGMTVDLTRPDVLVGRHSEADVRLPLPDVSRRHCRFVYAVGRWQVIDLNSLNGVYVNGEKVHQSFLRHRDRVRIGGFTFQVNLRTAGQTVELTLGGPGRENGGESVQGTHAEGAGPQRYAG